MSFTTYKESFVKETTYREDIKFDSLCKYGIKPLDDALRAIAPNELIVIAAGSGIGKTELSLHISRTNALRGKRVAHFNLEGGWREAVQRMKWREMCNIYYERYHMKGHFVELDYRKWVLNELNNDLLRKIESEAYENLKTVGENLWLYNNPNGLNCKEFCASLLSFHNLEFAAMNFGGLKKAGFELDLIVIDHLHYFSLDKDENEIGEITAILKAVKDITEVFNIPVILVAHLRKLPRGHGIADKEDIYGTSNIHKIANTCIILAPDHEKDDYSQGQYPTYIRIAKSRQGLRPNLLMYSSFDIHTRSYGEHYDLYKCFPDGSVANDSLKDFEKPLWARSTTNL